MPRFVDHDARRDDILNATKAIIAELGLAGLSFKEIGRRLGGSSTMVTHYFTSQAELLDYLVARSIETWSREFAEMEQRFPNQIDRLEAFLFEWLLPVEEQSLTDERMRVNLVAAGNVGAATQPALDAWESSMQAVLHELLQGVVPDSEIDIIADVLRSTSNGIVLSAVEHPDHWTPERQRAVFVRVVQSLGLLTPKVRGERA